MESIDEDAEAKVGQFAHENETSRQIGGDAIGNGRRREDERLVHVEDEHFPRQARENEEETLVSPSTSS